MTKAQWRAVYDFCRENCIKVNELLSELRENGTMGQNASLEELSDYTDGSTYNAMKEFLEENV